MDRVENQEESGLKQFLVLTYTLSWLCWILVVVYASSQGTVGVLEPLVYVGVFGPLVSALIVVFNKKGKTGLQEFVLQLTKVETKSILFVLVLLLPFLLYFSAIALSILYGSIFPELFSSLWVDWVFLLIYSILLSGGLEEPGWRGFALPALQRKYNAGQSSIFLGIVWAVWHIPLFYIPGYSTVGSSFFGLLLMGIPLSFIFTFIYNSSKSVIQCIILHSMFNFVAASVLVQQSDSTFGLIFLMLLWLTAILIIIKFKFEHLQMKQDPTIK